MYHHTSLCDFPSLMLFIKLIHHLFENQKSTSNSYIIFLKMKHHMMYVMYRNIISHPCVRTPRDKKFKIIILTKATVGDSESIKKIPLKNYLFHFLPEQWPNLRLDLNNDFSAPKKRTPRVDKRQKLFYSSSNYSTEVPFQHLFSSSCAFPFY